MLEIIHYYTIHTYINIISSSSYIRWERNIYIFDHIMDVLQFHQSPICFARTPYDTNQVQ